LGVVLALAAGTVVVYGVSSYLGASVPSVKVVVAARYLPSGTILSATPITTREVGCGFVRISDAFTVKQVNADVAPPGAYVYQGDFQLMARLNLQVIFLPFHAGDILRTDDSRLGRVNLPAGTRVTCRNGCCK
jgi:hypothetical protein